MSASNKKKLRHEQDAAKLTEKQLAAQKEEKQTKLYTIGFVAVLAVLLVVAIIVGVNQTVTSSGIREKNTVALTVGDHEISNVEMNYFYMDSVNKFYSQYGSMASIFGLDPTKPLDEQVVDEETGMTWADDFLNSAKNSAQSVYAMADAAEAAGFALSDAQALEIDYQIKNLDAYAAMYGYSDADAYLKAMYGNGASKESFEAYSKRSALASAYYAEYANSLVYEDADLRAAEAENPDAYSSFTFSSYYLAASKFRTGGTTDADGNTTYSEEETAAAVQAAEEAAKSLTSAEITSAADLDAAIAALPVNADTTAASTANVDTLYADVSATYVDWLADSARKEGDLAYFANTSTTTAEDGTESTTVNGYYIVYYVGTNDNTFPLANVRHILLAPEHNHEDGETHPEGETYSAEELAAAKSAAEAVLAEWKSGEATEESFAELANAKSADGDGTTGGLYENVYPGQMVASFNDWCFDQARKPGDTGIVESTYGSHVMYYVGDSEQNYRDFQIETQLRNADVSDWYAETVNAAAVTDGDTRYIRTNLVLGGAQ